MQDIVTWAEGPFGFYVDRHWDERTGRWILEKTPVKLSAYHADILRHCFTPDEDGRLPYDLIAWCEPAKSGKSMVAGLVAEWMALHGDPNSSIVMASNKQNQAASLMFKSLTDSVEYNRHLPGVTANRYDVSFSNGNQVKAIASNSRGEAGARFSLALFDELWGYVFEDGQRLWSEFKTDPTRTNSVKFAVGYGGYLESDLWLEALESGMDEPVPELEHIRNPDGQPACWRNGRNFTFWSHVCRQPWQTEQWIESQRRSLRPAEFSRMIVCVFVESVGDFLPPGAWETLIDKDHVALPPGSSPMVYVGLDLATAPGGDDAALVGVYAEDGMVKLAFHRLWKGSDRRERLKLSETVEPALKLVQEAYRLAGVWFDPFQALQLAENLRRAGILCHEVAQTHSTRGPKDTALWQMCSDGRLVLYDDDEVQAAAGYASAKELGNGQVFLQKAGPRHGKIDFMVALANVADEALKVQPRYLTFL